MFVCENDDGVDSLWLSPILLILDGAIVWNCEGVVCWGCDGAMGTAFGY